MKTLRASRQTRKPRLWHDVVPEALVPGERDTVTGRIPSARPHDSDSKRRQDERHQPARRNSRRRRNRLPRRPILVTAVAFAAVAATTTAAVAAVHHQRRADHDQITAAAIAVPAAITTPSPSTTPPSAPTPTLSPAPRPSAPRVPAHRSYKGKAVVDGRSTSARPRPRRGSPSRSPRSPARRASTAIWPNPPAAPTCPSTFGMHRRAATR